MSTDQLPAAEYRVFPSNKSYMLGKIFDKYYAKKKDAETQMTTGDIEDDTVMVDAAATANADIDDHRRRNSSQTTGVTTELKLKLKTKHHPAKATIADGKRV